MKRSKTILLICGVVIAIVLSVTQSLQASETQDFIQAKSAANYQPNEKVSHLTITSFSFELFLKNLPYLNSK
ncbi:MAG: hypothetical protein KI791_12450 [Cyclobacteriaceae bacterium]|nr:hypothetical protein [Cyclobacteriaceae bacterium SS2]